MCGRETWCVTHALDMAAACALPLRIPTASWSEAEALAFGALKGIAPMWVTGGWVRDAALEQSRLNSAALSSWARLRQLSGFPPGDLDLLVGDITAQDFHAACKKRHSLRAVLQGPPVLVRASNGRALGTVKLRLPGRDVDVTSLLDAQLLWAESSGSSPPLGNLANGPGEARAALKQDASHRDITINALHYDLESEEVLDLGVRSGLQDLAAGRVRVPHPDGVAASLREDPLRLLRAFRFAARFGFELHDELDAQLSDECPEVLDQLKTVRHGRLLFELKKALLLHNRPSRFLAFLAGPADLSHWIFCGEAGEQPFSTASWASAVGRVRRLEDLILEGVDRGALSSRSAFWRGRQQHGLRAALLLSDWRKSIVYENDWAELLLGAVFWSSAPDVLRRVGERLRISNVMLENISTLQQEARQKCRGTGAVPPGVRLLRAAADGGAESVPSEFWKHWPCPRASVEPELYEWRA